MLSQQRVHELFHYEPDTGIFTRKTSPWKNAKAGSVANHRHKKYRGYSQIIVDRKVYFTHRVVWLYVHGSMPDGRILKIDHINGDTGDNRLANLRLATGSQNHANSRRARNNTSGFKGVSRFRDKWRANVTKDNRKIFLGLFDAPEAAHAAYCAAAQELHGEFARAA